MGKLVLLGGILGMVLAPFAATIMNSDSTAEDYFCPGDATYEMAEWFFPTSYPCTLTAVAFYCGPNTGTLHWRVWDDDGIDPISGNPGDPGTIVAEGNYDVTTPYSWITIPLSSPAVFSDGKFYIGWEQLISDTVRAMKIGFDRTPPHSNYCALHYYDPITMMWYWVLLYDPEYDVGDQGDLLIAAVVGEALKVLEPDGSVRPFLTDIRYKNNVLSLYFSLPVETTVSVDVFDISGRNVWHTSGYSLSGRVDFQGLFLPSGVYFARVNVGGLQTTRSFCVVK